jgi:hypothetical protein
MADSGSENIGNIDVSIGADYSPLQAAFSAAQDAAQQAGADIADALVSGAAGAGDIGDEISGQLDQIGPSADDAAGSLEGFAGAAGDAGEASEEGASKLAEMAEQLAAVGEALVITEGLRELGSEALGAADSITRASLALTQITGSGDTAKETIEGLEQLGMSDGLSMPSLLSAATRMQAILGPSADVVGELATVANGAAVMGTDIETAATKFDQMATAGTASARTLTSLGISLAGLATALNQVIPGSDATASSVAAMFKALDQSQRVDVLNQALSSLGGTAQTVAEQTFGGQWQQLANAWEGIMVQVGQAILPVVSDLLEFTKTDIVPFIQGLVSAFTELPEPLKDTAVGVSLAAAAIIPLTGGLAALGISFSGLGGLLPAVTGLLETFGITAGEVAAEETVAATATEGVGVAAEAASVGAAGLAGIVGGVLVVGLVAAVASLTDLQARLKAAQSAYEGVSQTDFNSWLQAGIAGLKTAAISTEDLEAEQVKLKQALDLGVISGQQYASAISAIEAAMKRVAAEDLSEAVSQYSSGLHILTDATTKATDQQTLLNAVLADAQAKFQQAAAGYQAGTTTAQQYLQAQNAVTAAQTALQASMGPLPGSMDAITAAATKLATASGFVVSAQQEQANETAVAKSSLDLANVSYDTSVAKLDLLKVQLDDANAAYADGIAPRAAVITAEQNLQGAYAAEQKELAGLQTTADAYAQTMSANVVAGDKAALAGLQDLAAGISPVAAGLIGLDGVIEALQKTMPNFGVIMTTMSTGPLAGLQSALTEASAKVADLNQQMQAGANVGQQYEKALTAQLNAQIALDQEIAVLNVGLQGATDAYSLARDAVAAAQAKVDDLTQAFQSGLATYAQVQSAQKALASAQAELTAAQNAGATAANSLSTANQGLASSAPAAAAGLNTIATAAASATAQLNDVAAAVQGIEADMKSAFGSGSASQSISAPAGYTASIQFLPGTNGGGSETVTWVPDAATIATDEQAQAKQEYAAGYTPAAIAKQFGAPIDTVLGWLGVAASAANQTSAQASASSNAQLTLSPTQPGSSLPLPGAGSTTTSTSSSAVPVTTTSGAGSAAIDGGSYPAVTAHQATGEVWAVDTSGTSSSGGAAASSSIITTTVAQTINQTGGASSTALQSAISTIGGALEMLSTDGGGLIAAADATQNLAAAVTGLVARTYAGTTPGVVPTTTTGSVASQPVSTSSPGVTTVSVGGGNPQGPTAPTSPGAAPSVPGYNPFGPGSTGSGTQVNVTVDARGAIGISGASLQSQITQAVTTQLVSQLYAAGARIGR